MEKYIALLRGVNISGKNKIAMPSLKLAFEDAGFLDVSTYINSGNVVFTSDISNKENLVDRCKFIISERFSLDIPLTVITANELTKALEHAPNWWDKSSENEVIHQAIFLISPISVDEVYKAVGEAKAEYEQVDFYKDVIFWSAPRATLSKTRWYKIASSSVNNDVTIRNASTAKKLSQL